MTYDGRPNISKSRQNDVGWMKGNYPLVREQGFDVSAIAGDVTMMQYVPDQELYDSNTRASYNTGALFLWSTSGIHKLELDGTLTQDVETPAAPGAPGYYDWGSVATGRVFPPNDIGQNDEYNGFRDLLFAMQSTTGECSVSVMSQAFGGADIQTFTESTPVSRSVIVAPEGETAQWWWVADGQLRRLSIFDGRRAGPVNPSPADIATVTFGTTPTHLAVDERYVWAVDNDTNELVGIPFTVSSTQATADRQVRRFDLSGASHSFAWGPISVDDTNVWVSMVPSSISTSQTSETFVRVNKHTGRKNFFNMAKMQHTREVISDGRVIYVAGRQLNNNPDVQTDAVLAVCDPVSGRILSTIRAGELEYFGGLGGSVNEIDRLDYLTLIPSVDDAARVAAWDVLQKVVHIFGPGRPASFHRHIETKSLSVNGTPITGGAPTAPYVSFINADAGSSNQDNWAPVSNSAWLAATHVRITSSADVDISGWYRSGTVVAPQKKLFNVGSFNITLKEDASGGEGMYIPGGADLVMAPNDVVDMTWDATSFRWRVG